MKRLSLADIVRVDAVVVAMLAIQNGGPLPRFNEADLELAERVLEGDDALERFFADVDAEGMPDFGVTL